MIEAIQRYFWRRASRKNRLKIYQSQIGVTNKKPESFMENAVYELGKGLGIKVESDDHIAIVMCKSRMGDFQEKYLAGIQDDIKKNRYEIRKKKNSKYKRQDKTWIKKIL